ncbi:hypothetical protein DEO72_LG8g962 [Vigna unguiculata]|uniref:Uncharacterized protein n=1 Tax=Vigna unguiculata TaxID=3917 RepID=A0A4D6MSU5_VIGUN|nr:hypothetical protein DEO72_LG8g962 [Vigna unguiculata]
MLVRKKGIIVGYERISYMKVKMEVGEDEVELEVEEEDMVEVKGEEENGMVEESVDMLWG